MFDCMDLRSHLERNYIAVWLEALIRDKGTVIHKSKNWKSYETFGFVARKEWGFNLLVYYFIILKQKKKQQKT